jgi:hypothetical protein
MATSTNGLLWFGVTFDGSPEDGDELPEKIHDILYGPTDEDGEPADEDDLYGDGREWFAEHGLTGVEFVEHCSQDYPMYGLAVAGTVVVARRGYPVRVPPTYETPDATPLHAALKALGVDDAAIGWHLASMWS